MNTIPYKPNRKRLAGSFLLVGGLITALLIGCATRNFVRQEMAQELSTVEQRTDAIATSLELTQTRLERSEEQVAQHDREINSLSQTAREALERARQAGKLAQGKLLFETVLTDDQVHFGVGQAALSDGARSALDALGERLKQENRSVFVEVQGHTDATGNSVWNQHLGEHRALAVRDYLRREHEIPLHRIATMSYGESLPIADNTTREGRAQNRRVVIVVLE